MFSERTERSFCLLAASAIEVSRGQGRVSGERSERTLDAAGNENGRMAATGKS